MKYAKHLPNVSKEYELLVTKQAWEPVQGHPGEHPGQGTQKNTKITLSGTLLLEHVYDIC